MLEISEVDICIRLCPVEIFFFFDYLGSKSLW